MSIFGEIVNLLGDVALKSAMHRGTNQRGHGSLGRVDEILNEIGLNNVDERGDGYVIFTVSNVEAGGDVQVKVRTAAHDSVSFFVPSVARFGTIPASVKAYVDKRHAAIPIGKWALFPPTDGYQFYYTIHHVPGSELTASSFTQISISMANEVGAFDAMLRRLRLL